MDIIEFVLKSGVEWNEIYLNQVRKLYSTMTRRRYPKNDLKKTEELNFHIL